jgi:hypothetical protein
MVIRAFIVVIVLSVMFYHTVIVQHIHYVTIPLAILAIGAAMNITVVQANGGRMPVYGWRGDPAKLEQSTEHVQGTSESKLQWLSDKYGWPKARFSLGDFFIYTGLAMFWFMCGLYLLKLPQVK